MKNFDRVFSEIITITRPWSLILVTLMYFLGAGVFFYLGKSINLTVFVLGLACMLLLVSSSNLLKYFYDQPTPLKTPIHKAKPANLSPVSDRRIFLEVAITFLTIGAVLTVLLTIQHATSLTAFFILGAAFLLAILYAIPPFRLVYSGYGELTDAIIITNLVPAFALILQGGEIHRLLAMLSFPVTALALAGSLSKSLYEYVDDTKNLRKTLLIRLGWQMGMNLHNFLTLFAYLLLGIALLTGLPFAIGAPGLLTLPIGIYQVFQFQRVASGAKPNWKLITLISRVSPVITTYLFTFSLWIK
jgi:1,4-dihydroxy-2-naphthoate octaprenyltransferase